MSIAFEQVSYSYSNGSAKGRRDHAGGRLGEGDGLLTAKADAPLWGTSPDAYWAIRNISFTLDEGEFFGIAGHTGSGKSTLIQHMNGLLQPSSGKVFVDGQNLADKKAAARLRTRIGLVFQYPEHQLFAATVYDDVAFGPRNLGLDKDEVDQRVKTSLEQVALDFNEVQAKSPFELSGGQQRRVALAGVLAMGPSTFVLDEPAAGLDPAARADLLSLITELHQGGLTMVVVSHSMSTLARLCDRILVLKEGEQFALGTPEEVFLHAGDLKSVGLGLPASQRLASSLIDAGIPLGSSLYGPDSLADDIAALYHKGPASRCRGKA